MHPEGRSRARPCPDASGTGEHRRVTETLVGHRIDRRMGEGDALASDGSGSLLRLVRIRDGDATGETALAAWSIVAGKHLQRVIDVGTAPNGDLVAVLDDVPHALADLVAARALDAGEAVTVLVPLAAALAELQAAGVVHGAIGAAAVALTDAGSPVLLLPRTATRPGPDGVGMAADRHALAVLARRLLPPPVPDALDGRARAGPGRRRDRPAVRPRRADAGAPCRGDPGAGNRGNAREADGPAGRGGCGGIRPRRPGALRRSVRGARVRMRDAAAGVRRGCGWRPPRRSWGSLRRCCCCPVTVRRPGRGPTGRTRRGPSSHRPGRRAARARARARSDSDSDPDPDSVGERGCHRPRRRRHRAARGTGSLHRGRHVQLPSATDDPGSPSTPSIDAALAAGVDAARPPAVAPVLLRSSGATAVLAVGRARCSSCTVPEAGASGTCWPPRGRGLRCRGVREVAALEPVLDRAEEAGGVRAVHDAVVVRERQVDRGADRDGRRRRPSAARRPASSRRCPVPRIATCGRNTSGVSNSAPREPVLVSVNVPPASSSGFSLFSRVRAARSAICVGELGEVERRPRCG